jgi:hypothetical protein
MALLIAVTLLLAPGWTTASPNASRAQELPPRDERDGADDVKLLPNGKSQKDAILKAEREQNLKDAARLVELSGQLRQDLESFILPLATLKKTDEIEKLVKQIRTRMRHNY